MKVESIKKNGVSDLRDLEPVREGIQGNGALAQKLKMSQTPGD